MFSKLISPLKIPLLSQSNRQIITEATKKIEYLEESGNDFGSLTSTKKIIKHLSRKSELTGILENNAESGSIHARSLGDPRVYTNMYIRAVTLYSSSVSRITKDEPIPRFIGLFAYMLQGCEQASSDN